MQQRCEVQATFLVMRVRLELARSAWLSTQFWGDYYSGTKETAVRAHVFEREVVALEAENRD